jgi:putative SOS response-associated peptidase YedK
MWREPFAKRRCLVPASGLYEWPKEGKGISRFYDQVPTVEEETGDFDNLFGTSLKAPKKTKKVKGIKRVFKLTLEDEGATPFAFAGIWDSWKRPDGTYLETFALLTEPNELVAHIHDRLALILHPKDYDRWLAISEGGDPRLPVDLLHPFDSDKMQMLPANPAVGNANNNGPEMLDEPDSLSGSL